MWKGSQFKWLSRIQEWSVDGAVASKLKNDKKNYHVPRLASFSLESGQMLEYQIRSRKPTTSSDRDTGILASEKS